MTDFEQSLAPRRAGSDGAESARLAALLGSPFQGYAYSYPHKSAYRPFKASIPLRDLWAGEDLSRIFLYIHVPFCEMRCGFCNLFTTANPAPALRRAFLSAWTAEAETAAEEIGSAQAARLAVGGGTPTFLAPDELAALLDTARRLFGADPRRIPAAVETSPKTATPETLAVLAERGVARISIGAQSFLEAETRAMGRPQAAPALARALDAIRAQRFPQLNIDLIYGAANQTEESWRLSLERALDWEAEEIFLYPLYVRPRTGLDGKLGVWDAHRLSLYRAGRDVLLQAGYRQRSMRRFERAGGALDPIGAVEGVGACSRFDEYSCQEDGMLGLGVGARSYTREAHYSSDYAVSRRGVLSVIEAYAAQKRADFAAARHGVLLDEEARRRRFILKSVLRVDGLDLARFEALFGLSAYQAAPALRRLADLGAFVERDGALTPTPLGLEWSDAIGPALYAPAIRQRFDRFQPA